MKKYCAVAALALILTGVVSVPLVQAAPTQAASILDFFKFFKKTPATQTPPTIPSRTSESLAVPLQFVDIIPLTPLSNGIAQVSLVVTNATEKTISGVEFTVIDASTTDILGSTFIELEPGTHNILIPLLITKENPTAAYDVAVTYGTQRIGSKMVVFPEAKPTPPLHTAPIKSPTVSLPPPPSSSPRISSRVPTVKLPQIAVTQVKELRLEESLVVTETKAGETPNEYVLELDGLVLHPLSSTGATREFVIPPFVEVGSYTVKIKYGESVLRQWEIKIKKPLPRQPLLLSISDDHGLAGTDITLNVDNVEVDRVVVNFSNDSNNYSIPATILGPTSLGLRVPGRAFPGTYRVALEPVTATSISFNFTIDIPPVVEPDAGQGVFGTPNPVSSSASVSTSPASSANASPSSSSSASPSSSSRSSSSSSPSSSSSSSRSSSPSSSSSGSHQSFAHPYNYANILTAFGDLLDDFFGLNSTK